MINAFEKASGKKIPYKIIDRRAGDISTCYSDPSFAKEILNWEAKKRIAGNGSRIIQMGIRNKTSNSFERIKLKTGKTMNMYNRPWICRSSSSSCV